MPSLTVLFIEHDSEAVLISQVITNAGANVDTIGYPEEKKLIKILKKKHYDLVITDAFFLPTGQDHDSENESSAEYLLDTIIKLVRDTDSKRIKIALRTIFTNPILLKHYDDLNHVDYIWSKNSETDNLLYWRIKRIQEELDKKFPENTLVDLLLSRLSSQPKLPFSETLSNILATYRKREGEVEQVKGVKTDLCRIAGECGCESEFEKLFEFIVDAESLNVAGNPNAWGHLRHVLNVFWLGYFFLNSGIIDIEKLYDQMGLDRDTSESVGKNSPIIFVNLVWFFSALFHDVGLPVERTMKISHDSKDFFEIYSDFSLFTKPSLFAKDIYNEVEEQIDHIFSQLTGELSKWSMKCKRTLQTENKLDHGLISGVTLLSHFSSINDKRIIDQSAICVSLHNLINKFTGEAKNISFKDNPIASLLILCDQLEVWDRETGLESYLTGQPIESYELRKLECDIEEKSFNLEINYIPYRYIQPEENEIKKIEDQLYAFLIKNVLPVLESTGFKEVFSTDININFFLDGRKSILQWPRTEKI